MVRSNTRRLFLVISGLSLIAVTLALAIRHVRRNPTAYSYRGGGFEIPRPFLTRDELRGILAPRHGEILLEIGPGKGYYSLDVAQRLPQKGTLDVLDVQRENLDHTMKSAEKQCISNITATLADATELPYPDDHFDGAYLVAVLGEVPDQQRAIRESRRVVKPGGRVVIGEAMTDPHRVSSHNLIAMLEASGLRFEREVGGLLGTFYRFVV